jgi:hypothetical protein
MYQDSVIDNHLGIVVPDLAVQPYSSCFSLVFIACSPGLFPTPSGHARSRAALTVCDISGWRTRRASLVPGPNIASANPHRRNSASASTAASYRIDAVISTAWVIPSESVNETEHDQAVGTISIMAKNRRSLLCSA